MKAANFALSASLLFRSFELDQVPRYNPFSFLSDEKSCIRSRVSRKSTSLSFHTLLDSVSCPRPYKCRINLEGATTWYHNISGYTHLAVLGCPFPHIGNVEVTMIILTALRRQSLSCISLFAINLTITGSISVTCSTKSNCITNYRFC